MELIQATAEALLDLGFDQFTVRINDRRILTALAAHCGFSEDQFNNLFIQIDKLDKIGLDGVQKELLNHQYDSSAIQKVVSLSGRLPLGPAPIKICLRLPQLIVPQPIISALNQCSASGNKCCC